MTRTSSDQRRALPSVGSLLEQGGISDLCVAHPRTVVANAVRAAVASVRDGSREAPRTNEEWVTRVKAELERVARSSLRRVVNATGIVLHTNLGRAPVADAALDAIRAASEYCTLEYDVEEGDRGSRDVHCSALISELTDAEDGIVVNNCAAALVLALNTLATGRDVLVSRGELVEIGGSFRIPDIMTRSGARLVEVGTTNRTHLLDYRAAISERTAAIVKVHRSNFAVAGFVSDVGLRELAALGAERGLPVVFDLGSGLLTSLEKYGFPAEPTARDSIAAGASLVLMSGDKLLGGPQAGIVAGRRELVAQLRKNPLARAFRVGKMTIAALDATLALYRDPDTAVREIPTLARLTATLEELRTRADALAKRLITSGMHADVADTEAAVGAGAFPTHAIASAGVAVRGDADSLSRALRAHQPPVIGRIRDGALVLDLRTVAPEDDETIFHALTAAS